MGDRSASTILEPSRVGALSDVSTQGEEALVAASDTDSAAEKRAAAKDALQHFQNRPTHVTRPRKSFTSTHPRIVNVYFETVSSDIKSRVPYLGPRGLHIYIPTCSPSLVLARLEKAADQLKWKTVYEVHVVLGFLGQLCYCGEDHWYKMGWKIDRGGMNWPPDCLGVDRPSIEASILQLKKTQGCRQRRRLDGYLRYLLASNRGGQTCMENVSVLPSWITMTIAPA